MLDLHLSNGQGLMISTPSGDVEVWVVEVQPEEKQVIIETTIPEGWETASESATYNLHQEFMVQAPDGQIRLKVLRFRPRPDGSGGAVSIGIDAPREWPIQR